MEGEQQTEEPEVVESKEDEEKLKSNFNLLH